MIYHIWGIHEISYVTNVFEKYMIFIIFEIYLIYHM